MGGEHRISNFVLLEIAYTELYFTDVGWPDFSKADLEEALSAFQIEIVGLGARKCNNYSNLRKRYHGDYSGAGGNYSNLCGFPYLNILIGFAVSMMWFEWGRMVKPDQSQLLSSFCSILIASVLLASSKSGV